MMKKWLSVFFFASSIPMCAEAQQPSGLSSMGTDFYLAEIVPSFRCTGIGSFHAYALISSPNDNCVVSIAYFDANGSELQGGTRILRAKQSLQVPLDQSFLNPLDANRNPLNPNGEVPMYASCHIHSSLPINVSYYSDGPNAGALTLVLPTKVLGKKYVVASLPANPGIGAGSGCTPDSSSSEFAIVAVKDSTLVTITPNSTTRTGHVGTNSGNYSTGAQHPFQTTLMRGEVYWVKSNVDDPNDDMSGSIVTATQPVAVFAGNEDALHFQNSNLTNGVDQRNMIMQEMVPTQYWRDNDYLSVPFLDAPGQNPGDAATGDEFTFFTTDQSGTFINCMIDQAGTVQLAAAPFQLPPAFRENVTASMNASAPNSGPIMVEQYDYRAQGTSAPSTAPTMMNVVPLKNFATAFSFLVTVNHSSSDNRQYFNIIVRRDQFAKIKVWRNDTAFELQSLTQSGPTYAIPGHSELKGARFSISPGSYFLTGDSAFMVYQYGMLVANSGFADYYYEYAAPCGETFGTDGVGMPTVSVDTVCSGWTVHALDTAVIDGGIASIELLNDPFGIEKRKPGSDSGYVSSNVSFNPRNITVVPGETKDSVFVEITFPNMNASAWVLVTNVAGNSQLLHLVYTAPMFSFNPANFINSRFGFDTCTTLVLKNLAAAGDQSFNVTGYHFLRGNQGFRVTSANPSLPSLLAPGDSVVFNVCFNPKDTFVYSDTLAVGTECFTTEAALRGSAQVGIIIAEDYNFGNVLVGDTVCHGIVFRNIGTAPFTLTKQWVLGDTTDFHFDTSVFPITIQSGHVILLHVCYIPQDTGVDTVQIHWASDIPEPYTHSRKDSSIVQGRGIKPELRWTVPVLLFASGNGRQERITLKNFGTAGAVVDAVKIIGPDTSEFHIVGNQVGFIPMTSPFLINSGNSVWIDIAFDPDTTSNRDRIDTIIALDLSGIHPIAILNGIMGNLSVQSPPSASSEVHVSVSSDRLDIVLPPGFESGAQVEIFDALGRTLRTIQSKSRAIEMNISDLSAGTYFVRISKQNEVRTAMFAIVR